MQEQEIGKRNIIKRGTKRDDGKVFWQKNKLCKNGEHWITTDQFEIYKKKINQKAKLKYNSSQEFKDLVNNKKKERRKLNPEKTQTQYRSWRLKNKQYKNQKRNEYVKSKKEKSPLYKLSCDIKTLIVSKFRNGNFTKKTRTYEILGCSYEDFKIYIENLFKEGMSWDNRGKTGWHLDHIIPTSIAKTEEELIKLNYYTNFQPLWAIDNLKKGNKFNA